MRHTHLKRIGLLVLAAVMGLMSLIASPARAEFAAVGPVSAPHGFPLYYTDSNDLSLELCLDADWCFFDPVDPNDPNQAALGIGGEVFWWMAEAEADPLVANGRTLLVNPGEIWGHLTGFSTVAILDTSSLEVERIELGRFKTYREIIKG